MSNDEPAQQPHLDDHPDAGQHQYERTPREEEQLDDVGEGTSDDVTEPSAEDPAAAGQDASGPDAPKPMTSPEDDDR